MLALIEKAERERALVSCFTPLMPTVAEARSQEPSPDLPYVWPEQGTWTTATALWDLCQRKVGVSSRSLELNSDTAEWVSLPRWGLYSPPFFLEEFSGDPRALEVLKFWRLNKAGQVLTAHKNFAHSLWISVLFGKVARNVSGADFGDGRPLGLQPWRRAPWKSHCAYSPRFVLVNWTADWWHTSNLLPPFRNWLFKFSICLILSQSWNCQVALCCPDPAAQKLLFRTLHFQTAFAGPVAAGYCSVIPSFNSI